MGHSDLETWFSAQLTRHSLAGVGPQGHAEVENLKSVQVHPDLSEPRTKIEEHKEETPERVNEIPFTIAVHMRRGDACERWTTRAGDHNQSGMGALSDTTLRGRPCYATKLYVNAVIAIKR